MHWKVDGRGRLPAADQGKWRNFRQNMVHLAGRAGVVKEENFTNRTLGGTLDRRKVVGGGCACSLGEERDDSFTGGGVKEREM